MDYQVSARQYRPHRFDEVLGQPHVVQTLVNAITSGRIAHAFLFSGTRGVGKTTVARILAKALNCEQGPTGTPCNSCLNCTEITSGSSVDVIEIDGASNTSVDDVREIRENVKFTPFHGRYRVYIIDEVHMLSNSAFNALLKTLEEPPPHVKFIFATTEIHKIPATILSRCQHYNFRRIARSEIIQRLRHVATEAGIAVQDRCLIAIARASEGSMRDALSLLDQAVAFAGTTLHQADLDTLLGAVPQEHVRNMMAAIVAQDSPAALRSIGQVLDQGHDLRVYCGDLVEHVRNLLVASVVPAGSDPEDLQDLIDLSAEEIVQIAAAAEAFRPDELQELLRIFSQTEDALRLSAHARFVLEAAAVRATRLRVTGEPSPPLPPGRAQTPPPAGPAVPSSRTATAGAPTTTKASTPPSRVPASPLSSPTAPARPTSSAGPGASARPAPKSTPASKPATATPRTHPGDASPRNAPEAPAAPPLPWEIVLERIERQHPNIAAFLIQGSVVRVEADHVTIGYSKSAFVARTMLEKEDNQRLIRKACGDVAGRPVRLTVIEFQDTDARGPTMLELRAAQERQQKQALLDKTRSHPLVKEALEMFGGDLVEVRPPALEKETPS